MYTIVQVGANSGNDHVTQFVKTLTEPFRLILVEPIPFVLDKLRECYRDYPNVHIEQCAVSNLDVSTLTLYYSTHPNGLPAPNYEVSSVNKDHTLRLGTPSDENSVKELVVEATTLTKLFNKYELRRIDRLYIDVEGLDLAIILELDLSYFDIPFIQIETHHIDEKGLGQYMRERGYHNQNKLHLDTVYER